MGVRVRKLPRTGKLALSLQWVLRGKSVRSQEALGVNDTTKARAIIQRDYVKPIEAEMRSRRFDERSYLRWFPGGSKATEFRAALGLRAGSAEQGLELTIREFYDQWIEAQRPPLVRPALRRDYIRDARNHILPVLGDEPLATLATKHLATLRDAMVAKGLSLKTCRIAIDGTLRAMWRAARTQQLVEGDPFRPLGWQRMPKVEPDPFTLIERDKIVDWFARSNRMRHAFVVTLFMTGMRPSEAIALRIADVDLERRRIRISKSRVEGAENAPKTANSARVIPIAPAVIDVIRGVIGTRDRDEHLFLSMAGTPINQANWSGRHWRVGCDGAGVRYRKFYATRHTFITLALAAGADIFPLAKYVGSSVPMIQQHYAAWIIRDDDALLSRLALVKP